MTVKTGASQGPNGDGRPAAARERERALFPGMSSGLGVRVDGAAVLLHARHRALFAYWQGRRQGSGLPARADLDPLDIPDLLAWMNLIDVVRVDGELRYRHRLVGTAIVDSVGRELTGLWFHEFYPPAARREYFDIFGQIVAERTGRLVRSRSYLRGRDHVVYDMLLLPLAADGDTVDMLISMPVFLADGSP